MNRVDHVNSILRVPSCKPRALPLPRPLHHPRLGPGTDAARRGLSCTVYHTHELGQYAYRDMRTFFIRGGAYLYMHVCTLRDTHTHTRPHAHAHAHAHARTCLYETGRICMSIHARYNNQASTHTSMRKQMHLSTRLHACIHVYIPTGMHAYMHAYILTSEVLASRMPI